MLLIWEVVASTLEVVGFAVPMTILGMSLDQIKSNIILNAVISIGMYMIMVCNKFHNKKIYCYKTRNKIYIKKGMDYNISLPYSKLCCYISNII